MLKLIFIRVVWVRKNLSKLRGIKINSWMGIDHSQCMAHKQVKGSNANKAFGGNED
jgi:hypothetical protein